MKLEYLDTMYYILHNVFRMVLFPMYFYYYLLCAHALYTPKHHAIVICIRICIRMQDDYLKAEPSADVITDLMKVAFPFRWQHNTKDSKYKTSGGEISFL